MYKNLNGGIFVAVKKTLKILDIDPYLAPYSDDLNLRMKLFNDKKKELLCGGENICDFADGYKYFGFHKIDNGYVYREWAPAAEKMYLTGDFNGWDLESHQMNNLGNGIFEIEITGENTLKTGQKVQAVVHHNGEVLRPAMVRVKRI